MFTVSPKHPHHLGCMFAFQLPQDLLRSLDWASPGDCAPEGYNASAMKAQFENPRLFRGKRPYGTWGISDSFVDAPKPLCDIFYLLQCMIPGVLTITREEDIDDGPEFINSRGLPRPEWLLENRSQLEIIFDEDQYEEILKAAEDVKRAYICTTIPRQWDE